MYRSSPAFKPHHQVKDFQITTSKTVICLAVRSWKTCAPVGGICSCMLLYVTISPILKSVYLPTRPYQHTNATMAEQATRRARYDASSQSQLTLVAKLTLSQPRHDRDHHYPCRQTRERARFHSSQKLRYQVFRQTANRSEPRRRPRSRQPL
jgi:hypothetical protein